MSTGKARARLTLTYYEPVEVEVGPVRLLALRVTRREERELSDVSEDISKLEERLARIVADARRRGREVVVEAKLELGGKEVYYAESTLSGVEAVLYYRPARLTTVGVIREAGGGLHLQKWSVGQELYVYEGWVRVRDPEGRTKFVVIETVDGKRVLRPKEFRVVRR